MTPLVSWNFLTEVNYAYTLVYPVWNLVIGIWCFLKVKCLISHATLIFLSCPYNRMVVEQQVLNIHAELIDRCKSGDRDAHYKLYKLYSRAMFNVAFRITGREEDAEDALQEAFISGFRNLDSYRGDAAFGAWIKRIVVNKAINIVKKRRFESMPDDERFDVADGDEASEYKEELTVERVKHAIAQLPDGYRSVLTLYLLEGYDHQEIAEIMEISESTSKSQLNRAKGKLRELLTLKV